MDSQPLTHGQRQLFGPLAIAAEALQKEAEVKAGKDIRPFHAFSVVDALDRAATIKLAIQTGKLNKSDVETVKTAIQHEFPLANMASIFKGVDSILENLDKQDVPSL